MFLIYWQHFCICICFCHMADISFEFVEKSTTKVKEKCYIAILMVDAKDCSKFAEGELYRTYDGIDAIAEDFDTSTATYGKAQDWFNHTNKQLIIAPKTAEKYSDSLTALCEEYDWFGVVLIDSHDDADILDVAQWCESKEKIFWCLTGDKTNILNSTIDTDIASQLMKKKYKYTGITLTDLEAHEGVNNLDIISMARVIGKVPGTFNVDGKGEDWVNAAVDKYTSAQKNTVKKKNCNFFYTNRQQGYERSVFAYGVMANGDSLFQRRNIMYFENEVLVRMWQMKLDQDVILRDTSTVKLVQRVLDNLFSECVENNVCQVASKAQFAAKMGVSESEVENYNANGYILYLPDIMDDKNWESTGHGEFKYKNIVFQVMFNGVINQIEGTIILRKL